MTLTPSRTLVGALGIAFAFSACARSGHRDGGPFVVDGASFRGWDAGVRDASTRDASTRDASSEADACTSSVEACNGTDDDCDGIVDEESDASCAVPGALARCVDGACALESCLDDGLADCDGDASNGCETDLSSAESDCGRCGRACPHRLTCSSGVCRDFVVEVAAGGDHTCALRGSGAVLCWGGDRAGQLGDGSADEGRAVPAPVLGISDAVHVVAGWQRSCALRATGEVRCWGAGPLGDESSDGSATPVELPWLRAASIDVGWSHAAAIDVGSGEVLSWGNAPAGDGREAGTLVPTAARDLDDATAVAAGTSFTCARRAFGGIACWGINFRGQLGNPTLVNSWVPVGVYGIDDAVVVAAGGSHVCAVRASRQIWCWGEGVLGQLGDGVSNFSGLPVRASGIDDAISVSAGGGHTCAVHGAGTVACWGDDRVGQLGDGPGEAATSAVPIAVSGLDDVVHLSAGVRHTCAVRATGAVVCWGSDDYGQLGDGTSSLGDRSHAPVPVVGLAGAE